MGLNEVKAKKNAEYFEPSFKKVSFRDEISKPELDSSVKISEIDGQNTGSFKNSFVKHRDNNFSTSEYENSDLAQVKGKKKVKKKVFEDELNNFPKFYNPDQSKQEHNKGKVTSLFHNNPEIPDIAHRAVKPVREVVFSELCFEDLNLHPYMVCA